MLPMASGADKFVGIEGSADVSHCAVIMPVSSAFVPFAPTISKRTELYQRRDGCVKNDAVCLKIGASLKIGAVSQDRRQKYDHCKSLLSK
jgi:hypothetical protein